MRQKILESAQELEQLLATNDPFDLIAHFMLAATPNSATSIEDISSPDIPAFFPEYLALLAARRPYPDTITLIESTVLCRVRDVLKEIEQATMWLNVASGADPDALGAPDTLKNLQFATITHELAVRGPAYPWHYEQVLRGLFQPFAHDLERLLGFSIDDAFVLAKAFVDLINDALGEGIVRARQERSKIIRAVAEFKRTGKASAGLDYESLTDLASLSDAQVRSYAKESTSHWAFFRLGHTLSVRATALASRCRVTESIATKFLDALSTNFGTVPSDFHIPDPAHQLTKRPFLHHNGRYLCPSPPLVYPAILTVGEGIIKAAAGNVWNRFVLHRHAFTLDLALATFAKMMPNADISRNLHYRLPDNQGDRYELDGLIVCGSVALLVECKGGSLPEQAKRGVESRLARQVERLLGEAHVQAERARQFILNSKEAVFVAESKQTVVLKRKDLTALFSITLTFQPLGFITCLLNARSRLAALKGDLAEFPWMVNIYDLLAIGEIIQDPFVLPHYIRSRIRAAVEGRFQGRDELDFFGCYLTEGFPTVEGFSPDDVEVEIGTFTNELDEYLYGRHGLRPRAGMRKPTLSLSPSLRPVLKQLAKSPSPDRTEVAMALLDVPKDVQREFVREIAIRNKKYRKNGRPHNIMMHFDKDGGYGLVYIACGDDVERRLRDYCARKKAEFGDRAWYGLGGDLSGSGSFIAVMV